MGEGAVELVKKLNCFEANIHGELKDIYHISKTQIF